jgi:Rieske Fe-S protein
MPGSELDPPGQTPPASACRREFLGAGIAAALLPVITPARAADDEDAKSAHPKAGDQLVFAEGPHQGQVIKIDDIKAGEAQVLAWPFDPDKKVARDGTRLNQLVVLRMDPASLQEIEKPHAADGVMAFSAVCTHAGCSVTGWMAKEQLLLCPCHGSEYDPKQAGKCVFGPAPRPLAALPLKNAGGVLVATGGFIGKVGIAPMT